MGKRAYCHWCGKEGTKTKPIAVLDFGIRKVCGLSLTIGAIASCSMACSEAEMQRRLGNAVLRQLPWDDRWHGTRREKALAAVAVEVDNNG